MEEVKTKLDEVVDEAERKGEEDTEKDKKVAKEDDVPKLGPFLNEEPF